MPAMSAAIYGSDRANGADRRRLGLLLSIQAGYDARLPLSIDGDGTRFQEPLKIDLKGKRIA